MLQSRNYRADTSFGIERLTSGGFRIAAIQWVDDTIVQVDTAELGSDLEEANSILGRLGYRPGVSPLTLLQPRRQSILRWEKLPTSDNDQVAEMMRLRLRNSPFSQEPCYGAYRSTRVDDDGYTHVLAMFVPATQIDEAIEDAATYGLRPTRVEIAPLALTRILSDVLQAQDASLITVHQGEKEFVRVVNGEMLFSRAAEGPRGLMEFVAESKESIRRQNLFMSPVDLGVGISPSEVKSLEIVPITDLQIPTLKDVGEQHPEDIWVIAAAAGSINAVAEENLLPHTEQRRILKRRVLRATVEVVVASILLFVVLGGLVEYYVRAEEGYIAKTSEAVAQLSAEVGDLDIQTNQLIAMRNALKSISMPLETVLELYEITPSDIGVVRMNYASDGGIELQGEAPNFDSVHEFLAALHASTVIGEAKLEYSERSRGHDVSIVKFRIAAYVESKASRS